MSTHLPQQITTGSAELARRVRGYFGLLSHVASVAGVTRAHVSFVVAGQRQSTPLMEIVRRELAKAEAGKFERKPGKRAGKKRAA